MRRNSAIPTILLLLIAGLATASFINQTSPKKKTTKKPAVTKVVDNTKITWYNMTEGYAKAKKTKKMLVIDVYTDWCYWCKVMDQKTYGESSIIQKMNAYYVAVKFNPEVNGTHIVNGDTMSSDVLATYLNKGGRIPGYPMTFIWSKIDQQSTLSPYSGYIEAPVFNEILNKYIQE